MLERVPVLRRARKEEMATEVKGRESPSRAEEGKGDARRGDAREEKMEEKVEEKTARSF